MKKVISIFLFILTLTACTKDEESKFRFTKSSEIFDLSALPSATILISEEQWNTLLTNFDKNAFNEVNVECSFKFEKNGMSEQIEKCGVRIKGNTSRRRPEGLSGELHQKVNPSWHHAHFSIDFNHFIPGQKLAGLKKLNLKWFKDDANYVREIYCYDLFRKYNVGTAPRSSYGKLFIQIGTETPAYFGVYEVLESIDEVYIKERKAIFGDENGYLWKANWGADLVNKDPSKMGIEIATVEKVQRPVYDFKGDPSKLDSAKLALIQFIDSLNLKKGGNFPEWFERTTDVDMLLRTYNVSTLCGMWDDYWINKNNFYFYINSKGQFYFIPYDYDNTLGTSQLIPDAGTQDLLKWGNENYPLIKRIISFEKYKTKYIANFQELCNPANDLFYVSRSQERIQKWQELIRNHLSNDTGEDMQLIDEPAWWGNCPHYRLLGNTNNYFVIRASNLPQ